MLNNFDPRALGMMFVEDPAGGGGGTGGGTGVADQPKTYDEAYVTRLRQETAAERTKAAQIQAERDALAAEKKEREEAAAKEAGDWKKLAEEREKELHKLNEKSAHALRQKDLRIIRADLKVESEKLGLRPDAYAKLDKFIDMDKITLNDEGKISGHEEQLEALKVEMPFLFTDAPSGNATSTPTLGDGRPGGATPARSNGNTAPVNHKDRTAVPDSQHKSMWAALGK